MAENKTLETVHYEMLYIISNKYSENELEPILEKVKKIIAGNQGNITYSEVWGKKRLAYPIKHFNHGYYFLAEFDLPCEQLSKVDRALRMADEVLRHQIVIKKQKSALEIEKEKIISEKIVAKKQKEIKDTKEEKEQIKSDKGKARLEDLDEKLDKILDTDDLL